MWVLMMRRCVEGRLVKAVRIINKEYFHIPSLRSPIYANKINFVVSMLQLLLEMTSCSRYYPCARARVNTNT